MVETVLKWISVYGYAGIFFCLVFGIIGLPIPDETLLTFTGYLIYKGQMRFLPAFLAGIAGSVSGITISYVVGRLLGPPLVHKYGKYIHFTEERLHAMHDWFHRIGHWTLTFGYFIPGVRHFTAYTAGIAETPFPEFARFAYSGALLWVSTFIGLGYYFGDHWDWVLERMHNNLLVAAVVAVTLIFSGWVTKKFLKMRAKPKPPAPPEP